MKKWAKVLVALLILMIVLFAGKYYFSAKFKVGSCVQALDGYIWHINRYILGDYALMGWQKPWWGNEVYMQKNILERNNSSNIPEYHQIECPDPSVSE